MRCSWISASAQTEQARRFQRADPRDLPPLLRGFGPALLPLANLRQELMALRLGGQDLDNRRVGPLDLGGLPQFFQPLAEILVELDVAGRELPPGEDLLDGPLLVVLAIVAGKQGLVGFGIVGLHFGGDEKLFDRLGELPFFAIDLADRLAENGILLVRFGGLLVDPDDVGIQVRCVAKDPPQGLQGVGRGCWMLLPQATTAAAAASTASGVFFKPAKARA